MAIYDSSQIERRIRAARSCFAKAEGLDLVDAWQRSKDGALLTVFRPHGRSGVVEAVACSQPEVSRTAGSGVDPVLSAAGIAA